MTFYYSSHFTNSQRRYTMGKILSKGKYAIQECESKYDLPHCDCFQTKFLCMHVSYESWPLIFLSQLKKSILVVTLFKATRKVGSVFSMTAGRPRDWSSYPAWEWTVWILKHGCLMQWTGGLTPILSLRSISHYYGMKY